MTPALSAELLEMSREDVLSCLLMLLDRFQSMDKTGLLPEQHASSLITLALARDLLAIEMAEHVGELSKSGACVDDWGSVSTPDWVRHQCNMPSGAAGDLLHVGEQLQNLTHTMDAVRDGALGVAHAATIARHAQALTHSESAE